MDAYFALSAFVLLIALACVVSITVIQGERIRHLEATTGKLREVNLELIRELTKAGNRLQAFKPFDRDGDGFPGGSALDPYVKRALDRSSRTEQPQKP